MLNPWQLSAEERDTDSICDLMGLYAEEGSPDDQRVQVVVEIGKSINEAHPELQDAYAALERYENGPRARWTQSLDDFHVACWDAGWSRY